MNRTIKEATIKRFHHESHEQLKTHLTNFMAVYNFARRPKVLNRLTPYDYIAKSERQTQTGSLCTRSTRCLD